MMIEIADYYSMQCQIVNSITDSLKFLQKNETNNKFFNVFMIDSEHSDLYYFEKYELLERLMKSLELPPIILMSPINLDSRPHKLFPESVLHLSLPTGPRTVANLIIQATDSPAPPLPSGNELPTIERTTVNAEVLRLLIAEDNPVNLIILKKNIEQLGYRYTAFEDGESALNELILNHDQYFAVFMDCEMPILDGFIATKQLREWEVLHAKPPLPVFALTAHQNEDVKSKASAHGMGGVLTKPVDKESLKKMITDLIYTTPM